MLRLEDAWWPLALATMAGMSTSLGAIVAVVRKPSARAMAALLGVALGVMATVSAVELLARNAMEAAERRAREGTAAGGDPVLVLLAAAGGGLTYYLLEPFFPKMDEHHDHAKKQDDIHDRDRDRAEPAVGQLGPGQEAALHHPADLERAAHGAAQRKLVTAAAGHALGGGGGMGGGLGRIGSAAAEALPLLAATHDRGGGEEGARGGFQTGPGRASFGRKDSATDSLAALLSTSSGAGSGGGGGAAADGSSDGGFCLGSPRGSGAAAAAASTAASGSGPGGRGRHAGAARMLRLGLLMAVTMTLHNLPEGFAVAFSAFTDFGPVMALAIALHNIPEGVIVAAPIYAATGSRLRAIGVATASGLSEPLGALLSLLLLQPFFTPERLQYLLAFVGGVMLAVCAIELWPEGRNCRHDRAFAAGVLGGGAVMGWTLYVEG